MFFGLIGSSAIIQKRLKKEKKAKRKLQEALEYESKRREHVEHTLKQTSPSDSLRSLNGGTYTHTHTHINTCTQMYTLAHTHTNPQIHITCTHTQRHE